MKLSPLGLGDLSGAADELREGRDDVLVRLDRIIELLEELVEQGR